MIPSIILCHLGDSIPLYLKDCVHQLRLWNLTPDDCKIYLILHPVHKTTPFFQSLQGQYAVELIYTDTLPLTQTHEVFLSEFKKSFNGDIEFRKGYWQYVKERFYFAEELMLQKHLENCICLEYDVLLYAKITELVQKLRALPESLRYVMDNDSRGHPAFTFIPSVEILQHFNEFMARSPKYLEDMQTMALYKASFPERVRTLPVLPVDVCSKLPVRRSKVGKEERSTDYLSTDFSELQMLWDSLAIGQWLGGIDSRNLNGTIVRQYENESAIYSIHEMKFKWAKNPKNFLWHPTLNEVSVVMIHCHSKALLSFRSDRREMPRADYNGSELHKSLPYS